MAEQDKGLLGGIGDFLTHPFRRGYAKTQAIEDDVELRKRRMEALINSTKMQTILNKARVDALGQGGTPGQTDLVQATVDLGKIRAARDKFSEDELTPETAAFFDAAENSIKQRTSDAAEFFTDPEINPKTGKPVRVFDVTGKVIGQRSKSGRLKPIDNRDLFFSGQKVKTEAPVDKNILDFFQTGTETVPEENIPQTFEQLGITDIDQQQQMTELERKMPEVRQIYAEDPEGFKRLLSYLKAGKTPDGKPFGIKEALALLSTLQGG